MRSRARTLAHFLERTGLAMAGAAGGLFVGAHVGSSIATLTTPGFLIVMMIAGAVGSYLGIDTPPHRFQGLSVDPTTEGRGGKIDSAELFTAVGTFLVALAAVVSVALIVFANQPHISWAVVIMVGWVVGVLMQIIAGAIARMRS